MTALADAAGTLQRFVERLVEAAPIAWRHDPLFRGTAIGSGVTLAVLLLHLVGPHAPDLDAPTVHYDAQTRSSWIGPRSATAPPPAPVPDIPKIAPGQPLGNVTLSPVPSTDRFGTFTPGKHP